MLMLSVPTLTDNTADSRVNEKMDSMAMDLTVLILMSVILKPTTAQSMLILPITTEDSAVLITLVLIMSTVIEVYGKI